MGWNVQNVGSLVRMLSENVRDAVWFSPSGKRILPLHSGGKADSGSKKNPYHLSVWIGGLESIIKAVRPELQRP